MYILCILCTHMDLLEQFTGCGLGSATMAVSQWKDKESSTCSIHEDGCLSGPNLML